MITLKSPREIKLMREAGQLVAEAHQLVRSMIRPGITTAELDQAVEELFASRDAIPLFKGVPGVVPFPAVTCMSVNEEVVHGIPGDRVLEEGDILSVDTGCKINGWCGDAAWSYPVGQVDAEKQKLLDVGQSTLECAIRGMGQHQVWSEVADEMEKHVVESGFSVVEDFVGHGIGREMHEDPQVPNYVADDLKQHDFKLEPGLVLAVEPMVNVGTGEVEILDDHWTVVTADDKPSVHFEHSIAITKDGPIILTEGVGK